MQLYELKPTHKLKKSKRVGRGGKRGTYSGKGMKGQNSRSGNNYQPIVRGLIKRYHKLRGYRYGSDSKSKPDIFILNLSVLEKMFSIGEKVNYDILLSKGLVEKKGRKKFKVKILANGKISKKLTIEGCEVSKGARVAIEKVGGNII